MPLWLALPLAAAVLIGASYAIARFSLWSETRWPLWLSLTCALALSSCAAALMVLLLFLGVGAGEPIGTGAAICQT